MQKHSKTQITYVAKLILFQKAKIENILIYFFHFNSLREEKRICSV